MALSAFWGLNPWPVAEGRVMSDMLAMSALQIGNPVVQLILVKSSYGLIHGVSSRGMSVRN